MREQLLKRFGSIQVHKWRAELGVYFGAIVALCSGLLALVAWVEGWPSVIQTRGATMFADTAVGCILAGAGVLAGLREKYLLARVIGLLLAVAANLHLTADLAGFSLSIHNLFPKTTARLISPAQAAHVQVEPASSIVLFLVGCALVLVSRQRSNHVMAVKAAIGVVISAIGLIVLSSYACNPAAGTVGDMSFLAALCAVMLGGSVSMLAWMQSRSTPEVLSNSLVAIGAIGLTLILGATDTALIVKSRAAVLYDSGEDVTYLQTRAVQRAVYMTRAAESSSRLFLLTGNEEYLADYEVSMAKLESAVGDDELLKAARLADGKILDLIKARAGQLRATVELDRLGRRAEAVAQIKNGFGSALSDEIDTESNLVLNELEAEAGARRSIRQGLMRTLMNLILGSYGVAILLVGVTVFAARFSAKQQERTSMRTGSAKLTDASGSGEPDEEDTVAGGRTRVLLIDDSEDLMLLVEHALGKHGGGQYLLTWAKCLKDGFRELTMGKVDVVLLDLGLPESGGPITYACVRGCAPEVPIVVMTADDSPGIAELIVSAGVDDYLVKQEMSGALLVQALERVLQRTVRPPQVNISSSQRAA